MLQYLKAITALAVAVLTVVVAQLTDNQITLAEWIVIAIAFVNAVNTYIVPNLPTGAGYVSKALVVVTGAVLATLANVILGGLTSSEIVQLAVVGLQALLVFLAPNTPAARPALR